MIMLQLIEKLTVVMLYYTCSYGLYQVDYD